MSEFMNSGPCTPQPRRRRIKECDGCKRRYSSKNLQLEPISRNHYCSGCVVRMEVAKKKVWESGSLIAGQK